MSYLEDIKKEFEVSGVDINEYSPLTLAFIGDCVFDMVIRTVIVCRANSQPQKLHKKKADIVKAGRQSEIVNVIMDELDKDELTYYKRGRNAHSYSSAKNASISDYRRATGLEALLGYLYLTGKDDRALYLIKLGLDRLNIFI